jgi:hypothetical protein
MGRARWRCCLPSSASTGPPVAPSGLPAWVGRSRSWLAPVTPPGWGWASAPGCSRSRAGCWGLALVRPWGRGVPRRLLGGVGWAASVGLALYGGLLVAAAGCQPRRRGRRRSPYPPRARPVQDAGTVEAVAGASAATNGDSPYVGPLLAEAAADATLRLEPAVATVSAGRRSPDPGLHQAGHGRPDPGRRPPLHRPHQQLQPQPGRAGSG